jgi:hypothetical protein
VWVDCQPEPEQIGHFGFGSGAVAYSGVPSSATRISAGVGRHFASAMIFSTARVA